MIGLAACGSSDGDGTFDGQRACEAVKACGFLDHDQLAICEMTAADINAPRALTECADCLEQKPCAEISTGECSATCTQFRDALAPPGPSGVYSHKLLRSLTSAEAQTICVWYFTESGGENNVANCGSFSASTGDFSGCVDALLLVSSSCMATVETFEDCTVSIGEQLCKRYGEPSCQALDTCWPS
ncbi:MAG: hypothetical protein AB7P03_01360 [Kofleriaceae bacterium]